MSVLFLFPGIIGRRCHPKACFDLLVLCSKKITETVSNNCRYNIKDKKETIGLRKEIG